MRISLQNFREFFVRLNMNLFLRKEFEKHLEKGQKAVMEDKGKIRNAMSLILGKAIIAF